MDKKILILAVNPKETARLRLDEEVRDIEEGLHRAINRDQFSIVQRWALEVRDLTRSMMEIDPHIVHFCGHGEGPNGIAFENKSGDVQLLSSLGLANFFKRYAANLDCIVLNACYSLEQAKAISEHIRYVIGIEGSLDDRSAIEFAVGFYDALGTGRSYTEAYENGCAALELLGIKGNLPVLFDNTSTLYGSVAAPNDHSENQKKACKDCHQDVENEIPVRLENDHFELKKSIQKTKLIFEENLQPLPSMFSRYGAFIETIISNICFDQEKEVQASESLLESLRKTFCSSLVFWSDFDGSNPIATVKSEKLDCDAREFDQFLKKEFTYLYDLDEPVQLDLTPSPLGLNKEKCIVIPINKKTQTLIFIYGCSCNNELLEEIVGLITNALYVCTESFTELKTKQIIHAKLLDAVKANYGFICRDMYERRFEIFRQDLQSIGVVFEPIIHFDKSIKHFEIWGMEALARNPSGRAPVDLFKTAELWGIRFQTELDLHILEKAIKTYKEANIDAQSVRHKQIMPISINVYPNTVLRTKYRKLLAGVIRKQRISGSKIILEISEKSLIKSEDGEESSLDAFNDIKAELKKELKVSFAIDDFGTGYGSISRLLKIMPDYVKIDRDILIYGEGLNKPLIQQLVDMEFKVGRKAFDIIIEGLDYESVEKTSLNELVNTLNVEKIQGHLLSTESKSIQDRIPKEKFVEICQLLEWPIPLKLMSGNPN